MRGGRGGRGGGGGGRGGRGAPAAPPEGHLSAQQVTQRITQLLRDNPPALRLTAQGGGRIPGVIVAQNGAGQIYDDTTPQSPAVILRNDDYGRIFRIIADGTPVSVEFNVQNQYFPEGKTSYVTVGEIPGTDKADEVVMLGGHLDSWTSATGATDNAIGCAIMMEAARILADDRRQAAPHDSRRAVERRGRRAARIVRLRRSATSARPRRRCPTSRSSTPTGTSTTAPAACAARRIFGPPEAAAVLGAVLQAVRGMGRLRRVGVDRARRRAAATTARSPWPGCRASARSRIRSNTTARPGTPISTPTSASCPTT